MQSDSEAPAREPETKPALRTSRRAAWAFTALLGLMVAGGVAWGVKNWRDSEAIADVERSVGLPRSVVPAAPMPVRPAVPVEPATPAVATTDRLPPLALPGQRVPDAVLRDLPDWVATGMAPAAPQRPLATSGSSGDESAPAPRRSEPSHGGGRDRERVSATFARCPGAGESGAVECRRAICAGAARKAAACVPYRE